MLSAEDFRTLAGREVVGRDGSKIGKVDQLYADREDGHPTFVTVSSGLFGTKTHFVPVTDAQVEGDRLVVPYDEDLVKNAPGIDPDGEISPEEEQRLYQHYDLAGYTGTTETTGYDTGYAETGTTTGTGGAGYATTGTGTGYTDTGYAETAATGTVGRDVSGPETDDAMTRSEERLRVGKQQVEAGRVRLRKYIVTENVTQTVPVTREQVRIEREPITDANVGQAMSGPDLSEEEHEVTLHEERAVVQKETVPVERVRLAKEAVTEEQQVSEQLRKERIETEGVEAAGTGTYTDDERTRTDDRTL